MAHRELTAFLEAAGHRLGAGAPNVRPQLRRRGTFTLAFEAPRSRHAQAKLEVAPSALVSLLLQTWPRHADVMESVALAPPGRWPVAVSLVRLDGPPRDAWRSLVRALLEAGQHQEAQLCWWWCRCGDDDDLVPLLFKRLPAPALIDSARSATALLETKLRAARSKKPIDQLALALDVVEFVGSTLTDLPDGPRRRRFVAAVDQVMGTLGQSPIPAVRDAVRLARQVHARTEALASARVGFHVP